MCIVVLRESFFRLVACIVACAILVRDVPAQVPSPASRIQLTATSIGSVLIMGRTSRIMIRAQVTDPEGRPVRRAIVVFVILPSASGAGAVFASGALTESVPTDDNGIAQVTIERPTGGAGDFQVEVRASYDGSKAEPQRVTVTNELPKTVISGKWIAIAAAAAGAGVVGLVMAVRSGNDTTPQASPTRIIDGPGSVR